MNRTGAGLKPEMTRQMMEGVQEFPPTSDGNSASLMVIRAPYITEAEPIGSIPSDPKGKPKDALPFLLTNKLGERLAFERSGTRLYEAFLGKLVTAPRSTVRPEDVEHILSEEHEHFLMLSEVITRLGGDPTAVTPAADVVGVMSMGLIQVVSDPRTTVDECLGALLTAELTDNDCWRVLSSLAGELGHQELVQEFNNALKAEDEHLTMVRGWVQSGILGTAAQASGTKTQTRKA
jgi:ferritin-like metal-binding protein YciE